MTLGLCCEMMAFRSRYAASSSSFTIVKSKKPGSFARSISPCAFPSRFWIASSSSVPRPRSRASSFSSDGGAMNTNSAFLMARSRKPFLQEAAPCTSMSRMHIFPSAATDVTASTLVP